MHDVERKIARIAGRQDNVIARKQLLTAGLGRSAIAHRVKAATMQRLTAAATDRAVAAVLQREPRRKGAPVIRALLRDPRVTRSDEERALLKLIDAARLPRPLTNVHLHGYLVDAYWPAEGLVLEFDGWKAHGHRLAFETNRKRDQVLLASGIRVLRVTGRQFEVESMAVAARIAMSPRA